MIIVLSRQGFEREIPGGMRREGGAPENSPKGV